MENKLETLNVAISDYITSHPLISVHALEKQLGLPRTTISHAMLGLRKVPAKHIFPIICELSRYGFTLNGFSLSFNSEDGILSGRKWIENLDTFEEGKGFVYVVKEMRFIASSYADL